MPTVCNMTTTDLLNIGVIGEAMTTAQINCLPLDEDDIVASFGAMPAWTTAQVNNNYLIITLMSVNYTPANEV